MWAIPEPATPTFELVETGDVITVTFEYPHVAPPDLKITALEQAIRVETTKEAAARGHSFTRTIDLPVPIDQEKAQATHRNGVWDVVLWKLAPGGEARRIVIAGTTLPFRRLDA